MNTGRRRTINKLINYTESLEQSLKALLSEEQYSYDNLPDSFKFSEKGDKMLETIDKIDDCLVNFDGIITNLYELKEL